MGQKILRANLVFCIFLFLHGVAYASSLEGLKVTSRIEDDSKVILIFTNRGDTPISFDTINLDSPYFNMYLIALGYDDPVDRYWVPDSVISQLVKLDPGESYQHAISLIQFHDFEKIAKRSCLIFFWFIFFAPITEPDRPFIGGAVNVNCPNGPFAE